MKTLTLKVVHRLLLANLVNDAGKKGASLSEIKQYLDILGFIEFSEAEKETLGIEVDVASNQVKWDTKNEVDKVIEVSDEQITLLCDIINSKNEKKEFNLEVATPMMEIAEMLGIEL